MLQTVESGSRRIDSYEISAGREAIDRLLMLAAPLQGLRIAHVSATAYGGDVAEILSSEIPRDRIRSFEGKYKPRVIVLGRNFNMHIRECSHSIAILPPLSAFAKGFSSSRKS